MPDATRQVLLHDRAVILTDLTATRATLADLRRVRADGFDDDEHDPDGAPLSSAVLRQDALIRSGEERLAAIDASLIALDDGRYGVCERCGRLIPPARLAIRPTATRCVECADRRR